MDQPPGTCKDQIIDEDNKKKKPSRERDTSVLPEEEFLGLSRRAPLPASTLGAHEGSHQMDNV